jgi:hypothetical protein
MAIGTWVVLAAAACGGGGATPQTPATAQGTSTAAASSSAAPASSGSILSEDTGTVDQLYAAAKAAPQATLVASGPGSDAIGQGVKDAASKAAPGMQPDGPMATAKLSENGHAQATITLQGGKCYAIVGFSSDVKDLDLNVFDPAGIASYQDQSDDNHPVIGKPTEPLCPASAQPITYLLDLFADVGSGDVAAQLYSKPK